MWTAAGLARDQVFFVIRLVTLEVQIVGIVPEPRGEWMKQVARNLTDGPDGFRRSCRSLIHDRSSLITSEFGRIPESIGIETVQLPARSPNLNAFGERYIRTIKEACLDRMILIGEGLLRRAVSEFALHYHTEKSHQGLGNKIIRPQLAECPSAGEIRCRERLAGILRYYYRPLNRAIASFRTLRGAID